MPKEEGGGGGEGVGEECMGREKRGREGWIGLSKR